METKPQPLDLKLGDMTNEQVIATRLEMRDEFKRRMQEKIHWKLDDLVEAAVDAAEACCKLTYDLGQIDMLRAVEAATLMKIYSDPAGSSYKIYPAGEEVSESES